MSKKGPGLKVYCTRTCLRAVKTGTDRLLLRGLGSVPAAGSRYGQSVPVTDILPKIPTHIYSLPLVSMLPRPKHA